LGEGGRVTKYSTTEEKMCDLHILKFPRQLKNEQGGRILWPPQAVDPLRGIYSSYWQPGRGVYGWGGDVYGFDVGMALPEELQGHKSLLGLPLCHDDLAYLSNAPEVFDKTVRHSLLVKTRSSCRKATAAEVEYFTHSTAQDDVGRFDVYLSHGQDLECTCDAYVFLAPTEQRLTGQVKPAAAPAPS
jgi:hypothetical protein